MESSYTRLTQKTNTKINSIYRWRGYYLLVKPLRDKKFTITAACTKCFFKEKQVKCRMYCKNYIEFGYPYVYFQEINEMEALILKGDKNGQV